MLRTARRTGQVIALLVVAGAMLIAIESGKTRGAQLRAVADTLLGVLERRFQQPALDDWQAITGIIVLGGHPSRINEGVRLAELHPNLRIVISGPSNYEMGLLSQVADDVRSRIVYERRSIFRYGNTYGNAVYVTDLIRPAPHERWLLVTSAAHMPRAIGVFHKLGFPIEPWPVMDHSDNLETIIRVTYHEWSGLVIYWLMGRTQALLPT